MISDDSTDEWISTDHDRVFYRSKGHRWNRGELALAKFVADQFPGWTVVITMGPYRPHDVSYDIFPDDRLIHLDVYSVGLVQKDPEASIRPGSSIVELAESVVLEIAKLIGDSDAEIDGSDS